ncbi:MAG TPA: aspartyl protease family protein [Terriglobia bacterium]|nr:aspartyl protease family protein [Terriglobia bacterium]
MNRSLRLIILTTSSLCWIACTIQGAEQNASEVKEADALLLAGKLTEAKKALTLGLQRRPNSLRHLILLTRILLIEDEFDAAKTNIRHALELSPSNTEALALYGHCLFREGTFALAEAQYQKSLRLDSSQPGAHLGMGRVYLSRQQSAQSLKSFQQAIQLAPQEEDNYFFASEAYGATKNFPKQVESLEKYLALKPKFNAERVENAKALLTFFRHLEKEPVAAVADAARAYEISFQPFYGLMLVEGYVNGQGPFRFLVDSGATSTVLSNDLFNSLKIPVFSTAVVSCVGGTGKTGTQLAKVEKLKVGELEISNLPISSFDNTIFAELIDGVLSTADLSDFLITLDYPDRRILLKPRSSKPAAKPSTDLHAGRVEIPFRILGNLILAPISINQQPAQSFLFDTGAVTSTLSKRQAAFLGIRDDTPNASVDIQFAGACGVTQSVLSVDRVDLSLHTLKVPYAKILAIELKEISKELRTEVSGILGGDFYSQRKVTIDYRKAKLIFE